MLDGADRVEENLRIRVFQYQIYSDYAAGAIRIGYPHNLTRLLI